MKAFVLNSYAHPSKLALAQDAPEPTPGPNEVIVEIYSAALNFFDILQAQGKYQSQPPFPFVLGAELAGRIAKHSPIPKGCPFKAGDRVFGQAQGCYAERVATDYRVLHPVPKGMSLDEAAGLYVTWPTSYEGLVGRAELKAGEWVLVTAGAGGVGLAAVQIAKALGAKVIATAGSPEKLEVCKRVGGADYAVDYTKEGWQKEVLKITKGKGVDVIYDPVGRIRESLKCISWKGRAIVVGFAGGEIEKLPLNLVLLKNISIVGLHWGAYEKFEPPHVPKVWKELFDLFESGRVKPINYDKVWKLEEVPAGLGSLEKRETWGKAVVRVREDDLDQKAKL
ncbi:alcohol dehydrogenase [Sistotremastrum niveocremeum HHB9708]|uniref:Alcohol dehydrogenase n=2 Tax=Sistotremastraceae TaxID=3402574 RepID=A0A165A0R4_9AGAM|nr:alcohol dehydrogenase [Sistotremastrum niveocremeum HHB9708]KZT41481.1 NAD(P)-binding protein [Sistotremastrum suecicum HHB10207 ss-3]